MVGKSFKSLGNEIGIMVTLGNGKASIQVVNLLSMHILRSPVGKDAACANVVEIVQVLGGIVAYLVDVELQQGVDRLAFQSYIIIIGGGDNGHFGLSIAQATQLATRQLITFLIDALLSLYGLLTILIEFTVLAATLAESHLLHISDQQFQLVICQTGCFDEQRVGTMVVHADHCNEGESVKSLGTSVVIRQRSFQCLLRIVLRRVDITIVIGIGKRIQLVHRFLIGR